MNSAIIMAGGKGTRMKSKLAKVLHPLLDVPMVQWVVDGLKEAGSERIVTVVGFQHEEVEKQLAGQCEFALQAEQLGTGHAVKQATQLKEEDGITIVASGDCPNIRAETYASLYDMPEDCDMIVLTAVLENPGLYGRVIRLKDGTVEKIVEAKDASEEELKVREINSGIYAFRTKKLFEALELLKNDNAQKEYYLTDVVEIFRKKGYQVQAKIVEDAHEVEGLNSLVEVASSTKYLQRRINTKWMKFGVQMVDPENTYIGPYVKLEADVFLYPNVSIYGHSVVHTGSILYPGVFIKDKEIMENSTLSI
ncbi:NTP transferase domain-containing protein [Bulleidia sp. zg-1006]|uniref:NTP transferase domain-containing protein n=1 Tax=Bulleidia sp. zg-1006 TaxID=2806552 RepID=UPI0019396D6E|nr:NTP transferase domain-containing protein [Bulleidia sp. zg-1006]QRG86774.1 NTP transferase domain-containing protein [Bulleidia sp. zg-1006]